MNFWTSFITESIPINGEIDQSGSEKPISSPTSDDLKLNDSAVKEEIIKNECDILPGTIQ